MISNIFYSREMHSLILLECFIDVIMWAIRDVVTFYINKDEDSLKYKCHFKQHPPAELGTIPFKEYISL